MARKSYGSFAELNRAGVQRTATGFLPCGNCCVAVPEDMFYAVERFGQFDQILQPGFSYVGFDMCGVCIQYRSITRRVEQNECIVETKTKDNVFVNVKVAAQQSVDPENAASAMYRLSNVGNQVDSYVADVVRSQLPKMMLDEAFEKKDEISDAITTDLTKHMTPYGFTIHQALVTEVRPDQEVMNSMNAINKEKRLRDAAIMSAEADKLKVVKVAEAEADAAQLQGEGIARQRSAIVKGLTDAISRGSDDKLTSEKISELLLVSQYFETLKEVAASDKAKAIFVPQGPGEADISAQIRSGMMMGGAAFPEQMRM